MFLLFFNLFFDNNLLPLNIFNFLIFGKVVFRLFIISKIILGLSIILNLLVLSIKSYIFLIELYVRKINLCLLN